VLSRLLGKPPRGATAQEVAIARLILGTDDDRARTLALQLERTPRVERTRPDASHISVQPVSSTADLLFPFDLPRLDSPWVPLRDAVSARILEFRVVVVRPGFFKALEGRSQDGQPWPDKWAVDTSVELPADHRLRLPPKGDHEGLLRKVRIDLERWLGRDLPQQLDVATPGTEAQIAAREQVFGGHFPVGLKEFWDVTNGLECGDLRVFGYDYAYTVDNPHLPALMLAWDSDDKDDFVVVVSLAGNDETVYRIDIHRDDPRPQAIASDLRNYLLRRLPVAPTT
jgi:hypothetical protein